jgi:hypothetical protein
MRYYLPKNTLKSFIGSFEDGRAKPGSDTLYDAVYNGYVDVLIYLLFDGRAKPAASHLKLAISRGNDEIVELLLRDGRSNRASSLFWRAKKTFSCGRRGECV